MAEIELSVLAVNVLTDAFLSRPLCNKKWQLGKSEEISSLAPLTGSLPRQRIKLKRLYPSILP